MKNKLKIFRKKLNLDLAMDSKVSKIKGLITEAANIYLNQNDFNLEEFTKAVKLIFINEYGEERGKEIVKNMSIDISVEQIPQQY